MVALLAALLGAALGAALPFAIVWAFGAIIPLPVAPALHPGVLALAIAYGLLTALAFALWPLGRARDISVARLFRDQIAAERSRPRPLISDCDGGDRRAACRTRGHDHL